MSYNIGEYVVGYFCGLEDCVKMANLSPAVFLWSTNMYMHTDTHSLSNDNNRRECNALHFA